MFKTRITELFGTRYPIIQGGMHLVSFAPLAAAVSNAGGLGILTTTSFTTAEELRQGIRGVKSLTSLPFGANLNLLPTMRPVNIEEFIDVMVEEGVKIVETAARNPEPYMKRLKDGGIKVMHKVARVKDARTAEKIGVDAVCIVGLEAGGHPGMDDVSNSILLPLVIDAVKIPVLAAGGIGNGRGLVAALAMGAEGVVMGTRFMATQESPIHPRIKQWMLEAKETDTLILERSIRNAGRYMKTAIAERVLGMEARGATLEELLPVLSGQNTKIALTEGDVNAGVICCGQVVGLVKDIPTAKAVIDNIIEEARAIGKRLQSFGVFS